MKKNYKDLVTNSHTVLINEIEFVDEQGVKDFDEDTLYVHYHTLDMKLLEEGEEVIFSLNKSEVNVFRLSALLEILRRRAGLLNLQCNVMFEDNRAYFCFIKY